jgi:alkylhydroperoxidase/carboxymuconolactone decarboxylase family protein YurZ
MGEQATDTPVLDLLGKMTAESLEASDLDAETLMLVRIAALVAIDAPPASYMMNLAAAKEVGISEEQIRGVFAAIAPIVGTARIASAMGKIMRALGLAMDLAELEEEFGETA